MKKLISLPLCVLAGALFGISTSNAQLAARAARIVNPIDENQLVTLKGNTHPAANAKNDRGPVSDSLPMPDLTLVLSRSPEQQAAFDAFVASQYESGSPNYHHWLMPAEIGERFGPSAADIATISGWLASHGFAVKQVAPDGMTIRFGGVASQVESAFHTQIHNLSVNGAAHIGNMTDPQIPAALAPVVIGVKALHNFLPHPMHKVGSTVKFNKEAGKWQRIVSAAPADSTTATTAKAAVASSPRPQYGINVPANSENSAYLEEDVTPYDFATIYNVLPLWNASTPINGTGQTIAIAGTSEIALGDVSTFRSAFGLPAGLTPKQVDTGGGPAATECTSTDPNAACGISDLIENSLDVEWSGAVATGAQIVLVVTGQNTAGTIDTVYDSAQYAVENKTASILNLSYGECELGNGTAGNVAYYDLWETAAAEAMSVFVASGDAGSPSCDDGQDESYGNPYSAQFGLSVSGMASTPFNTAVGGTDFSWCKPVLNSSGDVTGCASSSTSQGSPAYWNTSNASTGESAAGYVPEIPWNDTCENPILANYINSIAPLVVSVTGASKPTTAEGSCNFVYNNWSVIYEQYQSMLANYVDTVGGSGGASGCVVNDGQDVSSCSTTTTTTGAANGSIPLHADGWVKPTWQKGVSGIPSDGVRDIPDVSFFAGDGTLSSAYLFCVSNSAVGSCSYNDTTENFEEEAGGTSFASPAMAGVMALINQKSGAAQGLAAPQLYELGGKQTYSECSAESVKSSSSSCYFNDVDEGTISMPCNLTGSAEGGAIYEDGSWQSYGPFEGTASPNCTALASGDVIGTLTSSGTTPAYNAVTGFDLATGLGSLNVANVVNGWASDAGTGADTVKAVPSATTIAANTAITVTVTVTGSGSLGTPTGTVALSGGGFTGSGTLNSSGVVTIDIPGNSLSPGTDTLTASYSGDSNYASNSTTTSVTVSVVTPTVSVVAVPTSQSVNNAVAVTVTVSGPLGTAVAPAGNVTIAGGGYSSQSVALSSGIAAFTIPANSLSLGSDTITATYVPTAGSTYAGAAGTVIVNITAAVNPVTPKVSVTPTPASVDSGQSLSVAVAVTGAAGTPTGNLTLTAGSYTSSATLDNAGTASFSIPANTLTAGTVTLTAAYSGDSTYASATGTASETVTASTYGLLATAPAAIAPGASTTSTITGTASTTDYSGTVTLSSCTATSGPSNPTDPPTCSVSGTITYASGTPTGSATATVFSTANTAMLENHPGSKGWLGAGGGAVLALLVFFGIPARRRSWRAMLGMFVILIALGSLSGCGGGSVTSTSTATTAGTYTFTVSGQGNDPASTTESTTFTVTVN